METLYINKNKLFYNIKLKNQKMRKNGCFTSGFYRLLSQNNQKTLFFQRKKGCDEYP